MSKRIDSVGLLSTAVIALLVCVPSAAIAGDAAAAAAAAKGPACMAARPFYWEIGDLNGAIAFDHVGGKSYDRYSLMDLASASKWPFGAYVVERYAGTLPAETGDALLMLTGYKPFNPSLCTLVPTVKGCFNMIGNHTQDPDVIGEYYYSGGNSQYAAATPVLLGLGDYTTAQLNTEIQDTIGTTMSYKYPAIAAGVEGSAAEYAEFLKKLMQSPVNGGLMMHDELGVHVVDTMPCPPGEANCSPAGSVPWHYGYHYWIEDNTVSGALPDGTMVGPGDGAYSSGGAYGFYPWISADLSSYGIVARRAALGTAYEASIVCGQAIRYAYSGYTP